MKLLFSLFILLPAVQARPLVVLSGNASFSEIQTIKRVLTKEVGVPHLFIESDFKNNDCIKKKDSIIQLCFDHYNFKITHQNLKILKGTFAKIIKNKKGLQAEGLGNL